MEALKDILGGNVRQYRRIRDMTQAELAEAIELSVEMVGKIERGTSAPSFETLEKLCAALDVSAAHLFGAPSESMPRGRRGDLVTSISIALSTMNDDDLERAKKLIEAFSA